VPVILFFKVYSKKAGGVRAVYGSEKGSEQKERRTGLFATRALSKMSTMGWLR